MVGSFLGKLKLILVLLLLTLSAGAQQLAPKPILDDTSFVNSPAWQTMLREEFLKQPVGKLVGRNPESYQQIIEEGFDIPVERLSGLHEISIKYWSNLKQNSDPIFQLAKIDVLTLKDLNLLAAEVWTSLVQCNDGNVAQVRFKLFRMDKFCSDSALQTEVSRKFFELAQNFQGFLLSSPVMSRRTDRVYDGKNIKLQNIHPLLTQLAFVQWAIFMNHAAEKRNDLTNALTLVALKMDYNHSVRENASFSSEPGFFLKYIKDVTGHEIAVYKLSTNSIAFLSYLAPSDENINSCEFYGLWPAINRTMLYKVWLWGSIETSFHEQITRAEENVIQNCGRKVHIIGESSLMRTIYGPAGLTHLQNMKILYNHWLGRFWKAH